MNSHLKKDTITTTIQRTTHRVLTASDILFNVLWCQFVIQQNIPYISRNGIRTERSFLSIYNPPTTTLHNVNANWALSCWTSICFRQQTHLSDQWDTCTNVVHLYINVINDPTLEFHFYTIRIGIVLNWAIMIIQEITHIFRGISY